MRVVAATVVIFGHAYPLAGQAEPGLLGNGVATLAVKVFFVTSGFLITRSWLSDPNAARYARRRFLRIMPALTVTVLLTLLVLGPAFSTLSWREYFRQPAGWDYLLNIALNPRYALPGVFANNPYPVAVNGSLWSLPAEVLMYVLVPVVLGRNPQSRRFALTLVAVAFIALDLYCVRIAPLRPSPVIYGTSLISLLDVAAYFQVGSLFAILRVQRFARPLASLGLFGAAAVVSASVHTPVGMPAIAEALCLLVLPFAVMSIGWQAIGWLAGPLAAADLSYGLYLWGFPVQQGLAALGAGRFPPLVQACLAFPVVLAFATVSWFVIERPAMRLKPRAPAPAPAALAAPA